MKQILMIMAISTIAGLMVGATSINNLASAKDGKTIFLESKCQNCHSIDALGIKRGSEPKSGEAVPADLSGAGLKHNADWITKWLNKDVEINGKTHIKKFKGSSDDLETLSNWLATQKAKGKK